MSLTALLEKPSTSRKYDKVEHAYRNLSPEGQEALRQLIEDRTYTATDIAAALVSEGYKVDHHQVTYFRRKVQDRGWPELPA